MTITEFLTARYDEEEHDWRVVEAREVVEMLHGRPLAPMMLADVAAKRAIVRRLVGSGHGIDPGAYGLPGAAWDVLAFLAQPYAEHPDFDPAWRVA